MLLIGRVGEDGAIGTERRHDGFGAGTHRRLAAHVEELDVLETAIGILEWQENCVGSSS